MLSQKTSARQLDNLSGVVRVAIIVGGALSACTYWPEVLNIDILVMIDAAYGFRVRTRGQLSLRRYAFALGARQTNRTLARTANARVRRAIRRAAPSDAASGCGQNKIIGALSMASIIKTAEFQRFKSELITDCFTLTGGALDKVVLLAMHGMAGGTGSEATLIVSHDLSDAIVSATEATVVEHYLSVGPMTSVGLGERIFPNATASLVDLVGRMTSPDLNDRVVTANTLIELPLVGRDREQRDALALMAMQARSSSEVEQWCSTVASNYAGTGRLGNITLLQVDFFEPLRSEIDVRPAVARAWVAQLVATLRAAETVPLDLKVRLNETAALIPRPAIEDIIDSAYQDIDPDCLVQRVIAPGVVTKCSVSAVISTGSRFDLSHASSTFAAKPSNLSELRDQIAIEQNSITAVENELSKLYDERDALENDLAVSVAKTKRAIRSLQGKGLGGLLGGSFSSEARREEDLHEFCLQSRSTADELQLNTTRISALDCAHAEVTAELQYVLDWVSETSAALHEVAGEVPYDNTKPLLVPCSFDERFDQLWLLKHLPPEERRMVVDSGIAEVTVAGLSRIVGATPGRLEVSAHRIVDGAQLRYRGPQFGGKSAASHGETVHVLPPMAPHMRNQIKALIKNLDPNSEVAFCDTAMAGANVVRLTFSRVSDVEELFSGTLRQALIDVLSGETPYLYLSDPERALSAIGIECNGNIKFNPIPEPEEDQ